MTKLLMPSAVRYRNDDEKLFVQTDLMTPDESYGIRTSNDVTVEIDIDPFTDVVAFQVATQFQSHARNICKRTKIYMRKVT